MPTAAEIPDDAAVIRCGSQVPNAAILAEQAARSEQHWGLHGVSGAATGSSDEQRVLESAKCPHPKARTTTAGRLREAGFDVRWTGKFPHVTIFLPKPITNSTAAALDAALDPPIPNPYASK